MKSLAALCCAALLSGCQLLGDPSSLSLLETRSPDANPAAASTTLAAGDLVVSGPEGYCVDRTTRRSNGAGGFAAIASCNILSDGDTGLIVEPVLVTVTARRATASVPSLQDIAAALDTELLQNRDLSAVAAGQMASGGETAFPDSDPRHWRGVFQHGDHLIGLALYAPKGSPLVGLQGAAFLNTVSSRIRAKSPVQNSSAEQPQPTIDAQEG